MTIVFMCDIVRERKLHDCKLYEMKLHCCFMVNKNAMQIHILYGGNRYEGYQMGSSRNRSYRK